MPVTIKYSIQFCRYLWRELSTISKVKECSKLKAANMSPTPMVKFNNGQEFPIFGLGTWKVTILILIIILFKEH